MKPLKYLIAGLLLSSIISRAEARAENIKLRERVYIRSEHLSTMPVIEASYPIFSHLLGLVETDTALEQRRYGARFSLTAYGSRLTTALISDHKGRDREVRINFLASHGFEGYWVALEMHYTRNIGQLESTVNESGSTSSSGLCDLVVSAERGVGGAGKYYSIDGKVIIGF